MCCVFTWSCSLMFWRRLWILLSLYFEQVNMVKMTLAVHFNSSIYPSIHLSDYPVLCWPLAWVMGQVIIDAFRLKTFQMHLSGLALDLQGQGYHIGC